MTEATTGTASVPHWPFSGRDVEVRAAVAAPRPGVVLSARRAGLGRTSTARRAAAVWLAGGGRTEWVTATRSAATIPFGAVSHLLAEQGPPSNHLAALRQVLARLSGALVVVDDAHLLDDASAAAVRHLAATGDAVLLVTAREGEPAPDAVASLWKDEVLARVELPPLSAAATAGVLREALGGPADEVSAHLLHRRSQGVPARLRDLVTAARRTGELVPGRAGLWRYRPAGVPVVPRDRACLEVVRSFLDGVLPGAGGLAAARYRAAVRTGSVVSAGGWAAVRGVVARLRGDAATAVEALRQAVTLLDGAESGLARLCCAELAAAHAVGGDAAGARGWLAQAAAAGRGFEPWVELAAAWTAIAAGDSLRGARHARTAAALARDHGDHALEAVALYDAARCGGAGPVRRRLAELAHARPGPAAPVLAAAATALAGGDATALDGAAVAFEDLGMPLHAAEAATTAALAHHRAGRSVSAARSSERAAAARRECPLARTPLLRIAPLAELTPRERDVAALAEEGLSSPTIARRLGLSVRTVDNHLGRVYAKLGVGGRRALRAVLRPQEDTRREDTRRHDGEPRAVPG